MFFCSFVLYTYIENLIVPQPNPTFLDVRYLIQKRNLPTYLPTYQAINKLGENVSFIPSLLFTLSCTRIALHCIALLPSQLFGEKLLRNKIDWGNCVIGKIYSRGSPKQRILIKDLLAGWLAR